MEIWLEFVPRMYKNLPSEEISISVGLRTESGWDYMGIIKIIYIYDFQIRICPINKV